ncbi:uncharacterized protein LOC109839684 [Asparagus officinalis]|uniref:uncharacterized protein LOC109839684 n=1 Tax=Asparagus officinalis TaxID=4686 RepID=UPI00098E52A2|nr:uncharacterized protein LOC109839684 [Asparagus officinalis]
MISVLAQERILGATLGSVLVGGIVFNQRRGIHSTISEQKPVHISRYQPKETLFGKNFSSNFANVWNKTVDGTLGNLVAYLSSRRW